MKFENTEVFNFEGAFRGMRNPKNSWHLTDSAYNTDIIWNPENQQKYNYEKVKDYDYVIGPKDMRLAQTLIAGGPEHRKFLRQIFVSVDITGPLFWWKEADTYKVSTVANSTSTMHKLTSKPITLDCFELNTYDENTYIKYANQDEHLTEAGKETGFEAHWHVGSFAENLILHLEDLRLYYLELMAKASAATDPTEKDELELKAKYVWRELVRWLPEGWLQTRTWTANYEVLRSIYHQRKAHKLVEWHQFCDWIKTLPYADELILN